MMPKNTVTVTPALIRKYAAHLHEQDHSSVTIEKYVHDLTALSGFLAGQPMTKGLLLEWKESLIGRYARPASTTNWPPSTGFCPSAAGTSCAWRPLKIQKVLFLSEDKELTKAEYVRLVNTAQRKENERLALVLQTICATGIQVSEL